MPRINNSRNVYAYPNQQAPPMGNAYYYTGPQQHNNAMPSLTSRYSRRPEPLTPHMNNAAPFPGQQQPFLGPQYRPRSGSMSSARSYGSHGTARSHKSSYSHRSARSYVSNRSHRSGHGKKHMGRRGTKANMPPMYAQQRGSLGSQAAVAGVYHQQGFLGPRTQFGPVKHTSKYYHPQKGRHAGVQMHRHRNHVTHTVHLHHDYISHLVDHIISVYSQDHGANAAVPFVNPEAKVTKAWGQFTKKAASLHKELENETGIWPNAPAKATSDLKALAGTDFLQYHDYASFVKALRAFKGQYHSVKNQAIRFDHSISKATKQAARRFRDNNAPGTPLTYHLRKAVQNVLFTGAQIKVPVGDFYKILPFFLEFHFEHIPKQEASGDNNQETVLKAFIAEHADKWVISAGEFGPPAELKAGGLVHAYTLAKKMHAIAQKHQKP